MKSLGYKLLVISSLVVLTLIAGSVSLMSATIIWVSEGKKDVDGSLYDAHWVEVLENAGYTVQREDSTLAGTLTGDQINTAEAADLVIVGRANNSVNFNDAIGWNIIAKPMIVLNSYYLRSSRWQWVNSTSMVGDGGAPTMKVVQLDHPIFTGLTIGADSLLTVLDPTVGTGNTTMLNFKDAGNGTILAVQADGAAPGGIFIAYWDEGVQFNESTQEVAGGNRIHYSCGTRESTNFDPYGWGLYNLTEDGEKLFLNIVEYMLTGEVTGGTGVAVNTPSTFALEQNFPNPFNPETTIRFSLEKNTHVTLRIYNSLGQEISTLVNSNLNQGMHQAVWNGLDQNGCEAPSGIYFYQLETEQQILSNKMILFR